MYRIFITVLFVKAALSAPQTKESDVTYVKIQPLVSDTSSGPVGAASGIRESRIEKLPLTVPGNLSTSDSKEPDKILTEILEKQPENLSENKTDLSENLEISESNQSDSLAVDESNTTDDLSESEINPTDLSESDTENFPDTVPSESSLSDSRRARNYDSIETTETTKDATEKYEDELIDYTDKEEPRTRPPPKFVPKVPKLSYFQKPRAFQSYSSNHLELTGKRIFKSKCSCQKIWNCPKLQITVPRCPDEYFLCCF